MPRRGVGRMKNSTKAIVVSSIVIVIVIAAGLVLRPVLFKTKGIQYRTVPVSYADISATVNETGTVNPVNEVMVGSEISGTIKSLNVDYNSRVTKGEVLAVIDPTTFQAAVQSAAADLALAQANERSAEVDVTKMKDTLDLANLTVQREAPLVKQGLSPQSQLDADTTAAETATADWLAAQAALQVAKAQVTVAQSQLEDARYNLSRTVITSPIDGIVMARNVSVGQTVAASLQTPTLFILATNLTEMEVDVSVDEADIGSVHSGQPATITVTAYPNVSFSGTVEEVRVNPTVVQNVVTYDAVVNVRDSTNRLLPGMTAQVTIVVGKETHVLSVPVAALLYRPLARTASGGGFAAAAGAAFGQAQSAPVAGAPGSTVTLWILKNGKPAPVQAVIGLSNGRNIEITGGSLAEGDRVIVAQGTGSAAEGRAASADSSSPGIQARAGAQTASGGSASGAAESRQ